MKLTTRLIKEMVEAHVADIDESKLAALKDKWRKFANPGDKTGYATKDMAKALEAILERLYTIGQDLDAWGGQNDNPETAVHNVQLNAIANELRGPVFLALSTVIRKIGGEAMSVPHIRHIGLDPDNSLEEAIEGWHGAGAYEPIMEDELEEGYQTPAAHAAEKRRSTAIAKKECHDSGGTWDFKNNECDRSRSKRLEEGELAERSAAAQERCREKGGYWSLNKGLCYKSPNRTGAVLEEDELEESFPDVDARRRKEAEEKRRKAQAMAQATAGKYGQGAPPIKVGRYEE